jgi:hypothetical protein
MATSIGGQRALLALLTASFIISASPSPLRAGEPSIPLGWGDWDIVWDRPRPSEGGADRAAGSAAGATDAGPYQPAAPEEWVFVYDLWQLGISSLSGLGPISPIQGRREVLQYSHEIRQWAPDDLELLVAASIAHQASDFKDRPFGTDAVEAVWRALVDDNISVGIAQLRRDEVAYWAPYLQGVDLLSPEMAIFVMIGKLRQSNDYILYRHPKIPDTDRYMLLALAQNTSASETMRSTVDFFVDVAGGDWITMLASERAKEYDWQEQLRLVLLHVDWLIEQGWPAPAGLDRETWSRMAFSEP